MSNMAFEEMDNIKNMIKSTNDHDFNLAVAILQNDNWSFIEIQRLCKDLIPNFMIFEKEGFIEREGSYVNLWNMVSKTNAPLLHLKDPGKILKININKGNFQFALPLEK